MFLLTYYYQESIPSCSGPGWVWSEELIRLSPEEARERIRYLYREIAKERHRWEHASPKWRSETFIEPYRDIQLYSLAEEELDLSEAQATHDETLRQLAEHRQAQIAAREQREREEYERLQAKFGEVSDV